MTDLLEMARRDYALAERVANPPLIIPAGPDYGRHDVNIQPGRVWFLFFPQWPELDDLIGLDLEMPTGVMA